MFINIDCIFLSEYIIDLKMSKNNMGQVWVYGILDMIWLMSQTGSSVNKHTWNKIARLQIKSLQRRLWLPYLSMKNHVKAGKYHLCKVSCYDKEANQGQECSWDTMTSDVMIHFILRIAWETGITTSNILQKSERFLFHAKRKSDIYWSFRELEK